MCEQTEVNYLDGEVVWVKLGSCWWPGEVVGPEKLPADVLPSFRKPPIAVVKFFLEDTYEYVKNINSIYKYNCSRKNEFISKGLYMYRTKHGHMEKFPEDVIRAENAVNGDLEILSRDEFQETKKESYAGLFGEAKKTPGSGKKGKGGKGRASESTKNSTPIRKFHKEKNDYKVHILLQGSKTTPSSDATPSNVESTPSTSCVESESIEEKPKDVETPGVEKSKDIVKLASSMSTPDASCTGIYACHACSFTTTRLNVLILHNKTHSVSFIPYTPSPVRKKLATKFSSKSTPNSSKTPKIRRPRKDKTDNSPTKTAKKRLAEEQYDSAESKKSKTDEEIKSSLLADWDDVDEESNDESSTMVMEGSPEVPVAAGSPAVPTPAELPTAQVTRELSSPHEKKPDSSPASEKPECSSDSKYEFCEDEDWPLEADGGRKIPRVKNPKRKEETKSLSLDDDDMAREVAELLNKTTVPELPSAPEPLQVAENFPEPSIVKSPDKKDEKSPEKIEKSMPETATKAIFKTKTFFRSRHSRSQDAIGKYVAEQLNAVERMDISESEINGSDVVSSPEARESPPIEQVKIARLAPKIQLKKMKAEAAQLREKEKTNLEQLEEVQDFNLNNFSELSAFNSTNSTSEAVDVESNKEKENVDQVSSLQDVLYPTQEIIPVTEEPNLTRTLICKVNYSEDIQTLKTPIVDKIAIENNNTSEKINVNETEKDESNSTKEIENMMEIIKYPEINVQQSFEQPIEPLMNESTASAVDALLSVSRETDRVTRIISNDPPEDLFEDDIKDTGASNSVNGFNEIMNEETYVSKEVELENVIHLPDEEKAEMTEDINTIQHSNLLQDKVSHDKNEVILPVENMTVDEEQKVNNETVENIMESVPSESDLQIAEALINLPSTAIQNKTHIDHLENSGLPITLDTVTFTESTLHIPECTIINEGKDVAVDEQIKPKNSTKSESLLIKNNDNINLRFETEREKCENLNAAQSLVQMSESIDHKINILESNSINTKDIKDPIGFSVKQNNGIESISAIDQSVVLLPNESSGDSRNSKSAKFETSTSKLLKILEEPCVPKVPIIKSTPTKQVVVSGNEKILNFDVAKSSFKSNKSQSPKQKIIIRRTAPNKNIINSINEVATPDKIILSRSNNPTQDGSAVQTFTIQTSPESPSDANSIIIQQKIRKITKPPTKMQKLKNSLVSPINANETKIVSEAPVTDDGIFDINSMPIVLSEDLLTPENIEKMPVVMSDGNIITHQTNPPKLVKKHTIMESDKVAISASPSKPEVKTLLMNPASETCKVTTPNILSKSSKLRGAKPMLVIDKATGKQKIIMTKAEPAIKEIKQAPALVQSLTQNTGKGEKYIILPTPSSPRPGRTQKILIDPQTGKAHVLVAKGPEPSLSTSDNKPVSAKLVPSSSDASTPGNTVMIITNAQGAQSRIVLTPEHEKILFPNKQQPNVSQLKTIAHRISTNSASGQRTTISTIAPMKTQTVATAKTQGIASAKAHGMVPAKTQEIMSAKAQGMASLKSHGLTKNQAVTHTNKMPTRIVPKQKSAIITSKGQLIVGGRVATTAQNIAPMPEIRTVPKRIVASEPKKLVQTIQKASSEPLIFLQQKSGAVMQLTAAQFEHLQRTGQIVQKNAPNQENKVVVQKAIKISSNEPVVTTLPKQRVRKTITESPTPVKKAKQEIPIAPAPAPFSPMPPLATLSNSAVTSLVPSVSNTVSITTTTSYPDLENFEELLPSTAIVKQPEPVPVVPQPEPASVAPFAPLSDGQLLAVPGEHFGGPQGSFYLCVEENGTLTPVDNRPLVLENNQLVPMLVEPLPVLATQPERRDILEAALANSDVFHADAPRDEVPDFRDLNANVSVHCRVSETSTTLNQPIMTPVEMPTKADSEPAIPTNLEDGLAVIGVTPHTIPTSLELPITVTDPRIALKTTDPLSNNNYGTTLLPSSSTDMTFSTSEDLPMVGPISMPLLTDDESVGKSMPILTDDVTERTFSSVDSTVGSPSSLDVRESETEDGSQLWTRRLLTPGSDTSETSAEIPLQPVIQLSVNDMSHDS